MMRSGAEGVVLPCCSYRSARSTRLPGQARRRDLTVHRVRGHRGGIVEVVAAGVLIWLALAVAVAAYGQSRGYPFFPLVVSGLVPGLGWALVLLGLTLAAGPHGRHCPICHRLVPTGRTSCDGCNYDFTDREVYES